MKIIQTLLMLLALSSTAFAETQNIQINQNNFELKTVMNEEEADFCVKILNYIEIIKSCSRIQFIQPRVTVVFSD
jgi:hypothetical protein